MNVETAHREILSHAAAIANADPRKPPYLGGSVFRLPAQTRGLALRMEGHMVTGAISTARQRGMEHRSEAEVNAVLRAIVRDSIARALRDKAQVFVAVIEAEARAGRNYLADLT